MVASTMVPPTDSQYLGLQALPRGPEDGSSRPIGLQQMAELTDRRRGRRWLPTKVTPHESPHGSRIVEPFLYSRVGQVEPVLQEVNPRHFLQTHYRTPRPSSGSRLALSVPGALSRDSPAPLPAETVPGGFGAHGLQNLYQLLQRSLELLLRETVRIGQVQGLHDKISFFAELGIPFGVWTPIWDAETIQSAVTGKTPGSPMTFWGIAAAIATFALDALLIILVWMLYLRLDHIEKRLEKNSAPAIAKPTDADMADQ